MRRFQRDLARMRKNDAMTSSKHNKRVRLEKKRAAAREAAANQRLARLMNGNRSGAVAMPHDLSLGDAAPLVLKLRVVDQPEPTHKHPKRHETGYARFASDRLNANIDESLSIPLQGPGPSSKVFHIDKIARPGARKGTRADKRKREEQAQGVAKS